MAWSDKYKKSINCNNPKGFSQKAHCAGRKIKKETMKLSELKETIRQVIEARGPSRGFNKLATAYQKEALKHQSMVKDQKRLASAFVAEKDPKKKEKAKKAIIDHHHKVKDQEKKMKRAEQEMLNGLDNEKIDLDESISENFTPEQAYNGLFKFKHKGKKYVGQVVRKDGGKYVLSLHDIGLLSIPDVSPGDMEYLGKASDQGKKGLPYLSAHPKNFQKVQNGQLEKELVFKGGVKASLPSYLSNSQLKDINKYYRLKLTKDDLKLESINEGPSTEEKRIAMLAVRKQAKYRNVSLSQAIQDQINALEELKRQYKGK